MEHTVTFPANLPAFTVVTHVDVPGSGLVKLDQPKVLGGGGTPPAFPVGHFGNLEIELCAN